MIFSPFKIFFCCIICLNALAQSKSIVDSLQKKLLSTPEDTVQVLLLAQISFELYASQPEKSAEYLKKGILLAQKLKYARGLAICYHNQGVLEFFQGEKSKAINTHLRSLKIAEAHQFADLIGANLGRIGNINREEGDFEKALVNLNKSIHLLKNQSKSYFLSFSLNSLGILYQQKKDYTKALKIFNESLQIALKLQLKKQIAICWYFIAETNLKQENYPKAIEYFEKCIDLNRQVGSIILEASALNHLTAIYIKKNQLTLATQVARQALYLATSVSSRHEAMTANYNLHQIFKQNNIFDSSLFYLEKAIILKDSLFNESKNKLIHQFQNDYEVQKKELEISRQKQEITKRNIWLYAIVASFLGVFWIAFLQYRNIVSRKKAYALLEKQKQEIQIQKEKLEDANQQISKQNEEIKTQRDELIQLNTEIAENNQEIISINNHLESLVTERTNELNQMVENLIAQNQDLEQFSYIVSHNLRAPVARLLGLLSILDIHKIKDTHNQQMLKHLEDVSKNLDDILKDLTNVISIRKGLEMQKEAINLKEIAETTLSYFSEELHHIKAKVSNEIDEKCTIFSVKAYVQSIILNLISNAIKYRNPEKELNIHINCEKTPNYEIFSIADNGLGIEMTKNNQYKIFGLYQRQHTHTDGKGLGLYLVKTQVEVLGGKIELNSQLKNGSTFKVYFPIN